MMWAIKWETDTSNKEYLSTGQGGRTEVDLGKEQKPGQWKKKTVLTMPGTDLEMQQ
jgi:hypothetical protein